MKTVIILLLLAVVVCIGCSVSYYAIDFTEIQLSENHFKISYNGGIVFNDEEGIDLTLLRSAEVAQKNGYTYFAIIEDNSSDTSGRGNSYRTAKPSLSNTIRCFKGVQIGPSYDVSVIIPTLLKKYNIAN